MLHSRNTTHAFLAAAVFIAGLSASAAVAGPVNGEVLPLRQPDGTEIQVRIWGDEFFTHVETLDGYTLVRDPKSMVICYARLSADGNELLSTGVPAYEGDPAALGLAKGVRLNQAEITRRVLEERRQFREQELANLPPGADSDIDGPTVGDVKGITLLIDFSDDPGTIPTWQVDSYLNTPGYQGYGNNGSVYDYYYDVSDELLRYTNFTPENYYRAKNPKSYYTDPNINYGIRARELIREALEDLDLNGFDFSLYDADKDGYVDAVNCFYAGFSNSAWAEGLWPHASSINFCADGVCTRRYQMTDLQNTLTLATFCHENGHMLMGWPDLYDYDYDSSGVGMFCLMCTYTSGTNPQEPCAYMKYKAGWTTTVVLEEPAQGLEVPADRNLIYKYNHPTDPKEYYLVENRRKIGRDSGLPDQGLAIWHVDEDGSNNNQQMLPDLHYRVTLVQADGLWELERNINDGDADDLWDAPKYVQCAPHTDPNTNWWSGNKSLLSIMHISDDAPLMTFTFITSDIDCNNNGVPDADDLLGGFSKDCNHNNIPDECDIIGGLEDDCNANGVPDACDLLGGYSQDCNSNGVPDECDLNPSSLLVTTAYTPNKLDFYHVISGDLERSTGLAYIPGGVEYGPNGNIFIWQQESGPLWEYNAVTGQLIGPRVAQDAGGSIQGRGIAFMPNGDILVAGGVAHRVPRFDGTTGAYLGDFVTTGSGGLTTAWGLTFGPNGNLFVASSATGEVLEYDGLTGNFVRAFVTAGSGGLERPYDLEFGPDDDLYVTARDEGHVYRYDGLTGAFRGIVTQTAVPSARGIAFGPRGDFFVASSGGPVGGGVYKFDRFTGELRASYASGPAMFVAVEPWAGQISQDCNGNDIPDECDLVSGKLSDLNHNNVPDQCEGLGDLNCDEEVNFGDINPFILALNDPAKYAIEYPDCPLANRDTNGDAKFDFADINPFIKLMSMGVGMP